MFRLPRNPVVTVASSCQNVFHEPHGVEIWNKRYNFKVVKVYVQEQRQVIGGRHGGLPPLYLHETLLIVDNKRFSMGWGNTIMNNDMYKQRYFIKINA